MRERLLLEHARGHIVPNTPYMTSLVTAVIGEHFIFFNTDNKLNDDEMLSPDVIKMNGCMCRRCCCLATAATVAVALPWRRRPRRSTRD